MKKFNQTILSIPPYISTSWKNINTLHMKEIDGKPVLIVVLQNGTMIEIPNLEEAMFEQVFTAHGKFLELETTEQAPSTKSFEPPKASEPAKSSEPAKASDMSFSFGIPFGWDEEENVERFNSILQHNPEQASAPDLPPEIIKKIANISKVLGMDLEQMNITKGEPHCNCMFCQLSRAIHDGIDFDAEDEEEVSDEDLKFRDWDIKQAGDKLYLVTNPLDTNEHYQVFLGEPVGCTCGKKNCEHIRTVLNS